MSKKCILGFSISYSVLKIFRFFYICKLVPYDVIYTRIN